MNMAKLIIILFSLLGSGCAHHLTVDPGIQASAYFAAGSKTTTIENYAPVFISYGTDKQHNKIGRPHATSHGNRDYTIEMDTENPAMYFMEQTFRTRKGKYKNLIYRIHFAKIPFSLIPFHLSAGKNPGLMVIITLDAKEHPVLVTTVHTCGCYLAIIPTSYLPIEAKPAGWKDKPLKVYGETLPFLLDYAGLKNPKLLIYLRPEVHRVMAIEVQDKNAERLRLLPTKLARLIPIENLEKFPFNGHHASFYYQQGLMKGYVKDAVKIWETVFLSLVSFDLFVGTDKIYGDYQKTGNVFYTSLKPWNRTASDMWNFARFLSFWGWHL
jgi:hypothetical protein